MKDRTLRFIFIPLLGLIIPFFSGIITYGLYGIAQLVFIHLYFVFLSFCIWVGASWVHRKLRFLFKAVLNPITKVLSVAIIGGLFGAAISGIFCLVWYKLSPENFDWLPVSKCVAFSSMAVVLFTMIYEIIFLGRQKTLYSKMVDQLDWERSKAEMSVFRNELDPHFMFNSLNTLSYLILHDAQTAHQFNSKLASVYKYFLLNKEREMITLEGELEFIENYFFVLQVRHENKLNFKNEIVQHDGTIMVVPYALQILVENAIKHNEFSETNPLQIRIMLNGEYLIVKNNKKQKTYNVNSTNIGLKNLSSRYRLVCNKNILIEDSEEEYTVKLPLIKPK